jgi:hypothetical protein
VLPLPHERHRHRGRAEARLAVVAVELVGERQPQRRRPAPGRDGLRRRRAHAGRGVERVGIERVIRPQRAQHVPRLVEPPQVAERAGDAVVGPRHQHRVPARGLRRRAGDRGEARLERADVLVEVADQVAQERRRSVAGQREGAVGVLGVAPGRAPRSGLRAGEGRRRRRVLEEREQRAHADEVGSRLVHAGQGCVTVHRSSRGRSG